MKRQQFKLSSISNPVRWEIMLGKCNSSLGSRRVKIWGGMDLFFLKLWHTSFAYIEREAVTHFNKSAKCFTLRHWFLNNGSYCSSADLTKRQLLLYCFLGIHSEWETSFVSKHCDISRETATTLFSSSFLRGWGVLGCVGTAGEDQHEEWDRKSVV